MNFGPNDDPYEEPLGAQIARAECPAPLAPLPDLQWWGYLHANGTRQLKRWFGDHADYTTDCEGNDFVIAVVRPFSAPTYEEAAAYLEEQLHPKH